MAGSLCQAAAPPDSSAGESSGLLTPPVSTSGYTGGLLIWQVRTPQGRNFQASVRLSSGPGTASLLLHSGE